MENFPKMLEKCFEDVSEKIINIYRFIVSRTFCENFQKNVQCMKLNEFSVQGFL